MADKETPKKKAVWGETTTERRESIMERRRKAREARRAKSSDHKGGFWGKESKDNGGKENEEND